VRLLITGGGGAGTQLLWHELHDRYDVHFADADADAFPPDIPVDRCWTIPLAGDPGFATEVKALMDELGTDLLIPGVDEELPVCERLRMFDGVEVLMPEYRYLTVMLDKMGSMKWLRDAGIPVPQTNIVKPQHGRGSRGVQVIQEHLDGPEYTVTMCADRNRHLHAIVPVLVLKKRGVTIRGRTVDDPVVIDACKRIHDAIPTCGTYNIQGIKAGGRFLPFEINPRFSTTTGLAIAAGVDPIAIWYSDSAPANLATFRVHLTLSRTWHNHLS